MSTFDDLSGGKFGSLLVIERAEDHILPNGKRETQYTCVCECGKTIVVRRKNLISGHTKTCGCRGKIPVSFDGCIFNPKAIECDEGLCNNCGWNPKNTALRKLRINRLLRKDGTNE